MKAKSKINKKIFENEKEHFAKTMKERKSVLVNLIVKIGGTLAVDFDEVCEVRYSRQRKNAVEVDLKNGKRIKLKMKIMR